MFLEMPSSYVVNMLVFRNSFQLKLRIDENSFTQLSNRQKGMAKWLLWPETIYLLMANGTCQQTQDRAGKHSVENRDNTGYGDAIHQTTIKTVRKDHSNLSVQGQALRTLLHRNAEENMQVLEVWTTQIVTLVIFLIMTLVLIIKMLIAQMLIMYQIL
jgi:hypothetical protein